MKGEVLTSRSVSPGPISNCTQEGDEKKIRSGFSALAQQGSVWELELSSPAADKSENFALNL